MNWRKTIKRPAWLAECEFARTYAAKFAHGTPGHKRLMLIAWLTQLLDAADEPTPMRNVLKVPYHSQHESDAQRFRSDCGPDCVEMVGEYFRPDKAATTDEIMAWITGGVDRLISVTELQAAANYFFDIEMSVHQGADWQDLRAWVLSGGAPVIVLVHYGSFAFRMDRNYTGGHFMVVVGFDQIDYQGETVQRVIVHDPDWYGGMMAQGAFLPVERSHFMGAWHDAWKDGNPSRMALVPRTDFV